jgi:hypothetical protein
MSLRVKPGVTPKDFLVLVAAVANTAQAWGVDVTITSGTDGTHTEGSRHATLQAIDVRSKTFDPDDKILFLRAVVQRLGGGATPVDAPQPQGPGCKTPDNTWLGILEHPGTANEHFHFELN